VRVIVSYRALLTPLSGRRARSCRLWPHLLEESATATTAVDLTLGAALLLWSPGQERDNHRASTGPAEVGCEAVNCEGDTDKTPGSTQPRMAAAQRRAAIGAPRARRGRDHERECRTRPCSSRSSGMRTYSMAQTGSLAQSAQGVNGMVCRAPSPGSAAGRPQRHSHGSRRAGGGGGGTTARGGAEGAEGGRRPAEGAISSTGCIGVMISGMLFIAGSLPFGSPPRRGRCATRGRAHCRLPCDRERAVRRFSPLAQVVARLREPPTEGAPLDTGTARRTVEAALHGQHGREVGT
jgi:hypothetical protein